MPLSVDTATLDDLPPRASVVRAWAHFKAGELGSHAFQRYAVERLEACVSPSPRAAELLAVLRLPFPSAYVVTAVMYCLGCEVAAEG